MIVIVDYGLGNLGSIKNALARLKLPAIISADFNMLKKAKGLILPGVGSANTGMNNLIKSGLDKVIVDEIKKGKPFLGICLGMQLLFDRSEEGNVNCLGLLKGQVKKFRKERKVPQIGWNQIKFSIFNFSRQKRDPAAAGQFSNKNERLLKNIPDNSYFYFVNSYYCWPEDKSIIAGISGYGEKFASIIIKNNIVATQFHPEKSGKVGFQFLKNWRNFYVN